jgi:peroxiredoxin
MNAPNLWICPIPSPATQSSTGWIVIRIVRCAHLVMASMSIHSCAIAQLPNAEMPNTQLAKPEAPFTAPWKWTIRMLAPDSNPLLRQEEYLQGVWRLTLKSQSNGEWKGHLSRDGWVLPADGKIEGSSLDWSARGSVASELWEFNGKGLALPTTETGEGNLTYAGTSSLQIKTTDDSGRIANSRQKKYVYHWIANPDVPKVIGISDSDCWGLPDAYGIIHQSSNWLNQPCVLVFAQAFSCIHCNEQLRELESHYEWFRSRKVRLIVIVQDTQHGLSEKLLKKNFPFTILADAEGSVFKRFGLCDFEFNHGLFEIDPSGLIHWSARTRTPYSEWSEFFQRMDR